LDCVPWAAKRAATFAVPTGTKGAAPRCTGDTLFGDFAVTSYSDRDAIRRDEAADLREAYERGRTDARRARRRHPVAMTLTIIAAAIGIIVLALAAVNGSFSGAGTVVDQNLATAATQAEPAVRGAATQAGQAVRDAAASTDKPGTDAAAPKN